MNRLARLRPKVTAGRKLLVPFLPGGYPDRKSFVRLARAAQDSGADALEVGIPSPDACEDGPVIREAFALALAGGASVDTVLEDLVTARCRGLEIPVVLMTYRAAPLAFGQERFFGVVAAAGVDGVLIVHDAGWLAARARAAALESIPLVTTQTPAAFLPGIVASGGGFVYCVAVRGRTGGRRPRAPAAARLVARVRPHTGLPVLIGFGVDGPEAVREMATVADGVIVGTTLVRAIDGHSGSEGLKSAARFLGQVRAALD